MLFFLNIAIYINNSTCISFPSKIHIFATELSNFSTLQNCKLATPGDHLLSNSKSSDKWAMLKFGFLDN